MHPPLYQKHPLCKAEVEALSKCHEENPLMKFMNACGKVKMELDMCFREEKRLRKEENKKKSVPIGAFSARSVRADAPAATKDDN